MFQVRLAYLILHIVSRLRKKKSGNPKSYTSREFILHLTNMSNKIIILIFPVLLLLSCSDEKTAPNVSSKTENQTIQGVILDSEFPYIIQNNQIIANKTNEKTGYMKTIGVMDGPYYIKAILNKVSSNREILINSSQVSGIPTGYYFCDVY